MPRTTAQNEQVREATRQTILYGAMTLFANRGYANTTMRAVAAEAGVSTGLAYHYFASKQALLEAVFADCMQTLSAAFAEAYQSAPPRFRLAPLLGCMFDLLAREREFWALFYVLRSQPAVMERLGDDIRTWTSRLRGLFVAEFTAQGRVRPEMDALLLYSLVEGTIQQYLLDPDTYPLEEVVHEIVQRTGKGSTIGKERL